MADNNKVSLIMTLLRVSFFTMLFTFFFAIIAGPNICHYINLVALSLTIAAIILFLIQKNSDTHKLWPVVIMILFNVAVSIGLMSIKYGYFNWHFKNIFELTV